MDFAIPMYQRVKIKENKKRDKYLDLARELKNLWNMKMIVIPNVIGVLGTLSKVLVKRLENLEIRGQVKTIQTTLLRLARRREEPWRLAVTQTPVKDYHLMLVWKFAQ